MAQQVDIVANLLMKVDGAEAGINKLKNSLSKLKMPEGLENSFKKSFANLDTLFAKYKSQVEKGFETKGDITAFNKTSKALDAELTRISKHFTELTGKEINFKVKSDDIIRTEKELEKLIEQKARLSKESLKFEIKGGKDGFKDVESILLKLKEAAGRTKTGENIGSALDFLKSGDVQTAISLLEKASVSVKRFKQEKQDAFKSETGFDMTSILTTMISMLSGAEGKFGDVNSKITETKNNLANFQAEQVQKAGNYAEELASKMENSASEIRQADGAMQDFARSSQSMSQQLGDLQQSTQYFFSLRNMINLFKRGVDEAIQSVKELDAAMTETAVVTDYKVSDMWNMLPQYTQLANQLGATTQGAYETMTLYFQQGLDQQQAFELGAETMKMARIAGLDYAETTDMMTAALRGFNMELNETSAKRVNDVYSELAAITASDTEELGTAMQRTASIAHSAGSSFEGTTAFLAQAIETTREPAENIGTAMKTIIARFQEMKKNPLEISEVEGEEVDFNKIDAALKTIGVDLVDTNGQFRDFDKVMLEISQKWDTLSQSQQRYIATTAAGSRQQSRFIAMVSDYDRTMQLMEAANNSAGASDEQFGKTMDSLESKLNKLHNAWQQFTMGIANNGMIKFAVDGITKLISGINDLIDTFSFGSGIIKSFLSLFTAFTGLKAGGKIINSLIGGLGGLVDPTSTFSAGFGRGMTGNRQAVNAAQAAAIYQPIVRAIYDTSQREIQNENAQNKTGAYDQYNAFKKANQDIRGLTSKQYTSKGLINELNQYDKITQRNLMRGLAGTELATTQSLMNRYRAGGAEVFKGISQTKSELRGKRNAGYISDADFFSALYDPQELLKHVDSSNGPGAAAKAYLEKISGEIESQAENSAIQNHISNLLEEGISQVDIDAFKQSDDFKKAKEAERQRILSQGDQGRENKGATKVLDKIGAAGAGVSQFGMAIQGFSSLLMSSANPAIQTFGSLLNSVGTGISSLGMGISGLTSAFTAISGSNFITGITGAGTALGGLGVTANMLTGGLMLLVGVIAGVALAIKKHRDNIRENAEKVTTDYKEKNEKHQSNISNLESYREDFVRLSAGVDSNGMNINLDTADYERYLEITRALADINPDIVDGYNAQGNAIINNKNALEDTLAIEKERQAEAFDTYTSPDSTNTLIKARNLSRQQRRGEANPYGGQGESYQGELLGGYEFAPQADMRKQAKKIGQTLSKGVKEGWLSEDALSDFNIKIDDLAQGTDSAISAFEQNYDKIKARISSEMDSAGDELKDSTKESMLNAFSGYNEAADELDELITPLYEQTLAKVGKDIQVPSEFKSFLNQGIKDIISDANITDIDGEIAKLTTSFSALGENGSEYSKILEDVEKAQDDYAASLDADTYDKFVHGTDGAVERIQALKNELLDGIDTTQGYGKAVSEFLDNEINKIENFTKAGAANLQQALNTMTSEIEAAEGVLENFNKVAEGSTYGKAASNMSQIFETATADEHALGQGDQAFWAGAEALVGRKNLLEGGETNKDKALKQMKEVQEMLKGGQEGWDNFKIKWFDSVEAMGGKLVDENGKAIEGITYKDNGWIETIDENINPEVYNQIADALNMSKESLIAMLNLGRQFGEVDFTNVSDVRKALATSESTIKNSNTGAVFVKQDALEAEMTSAGIDLNKQQEIEKDLQENYNTQLIKSADDITKTNNQFAEMGITSMESLVKTFDDTGQFTKDEIKEYAEKWAEFNGQEGELANFDKYWQNNQEDTEFGGIPSSLDNIESILSAIQSILASQRLSEGYLDNATAKDAQKWLFGGEGEDTNAQHFWKGHGSGKNGEITTSEFNKTSKDLTDFIATSKDYVDQLKSAEKNAANETEKQEIEAERKAYENMVERAETYLKEGTEAYNQQIQTKLDSLQKDSDLVNKGFSDLFANITPESINTDAAQSALNQLYEAAINNTPAVLTDGLMSQMQALGIDIQRAIDAGLVVDKNEVLTAATEEGKETAEAGVEGNVSGQKSVDTTPAKDAGEQKGEETGKAGVNGNVTGQNNTPHQTAPGMPSNVPPNTVPASTTTEVKVESEVDESGLENAKTLITEVQALAEQGATFTITTTGGQSLTNAANSAKTLANSVGDKSVSVTAQVTGTSTVTGLKTAIDNLEGKTVTVGINHSGLSARNINDIKTAISNLKDKTVTVTVNRTGNGPFTGGYITNSGVLYRSKGGIAKHPEYPKKGTDRIPAYLTPGEYVQNRSAVQYFGIDFMRKINHKDLAGALQSFGSAAKGRYGRLGPNGKGGLTLTGEKGFEVAWIPSENRSMILGTNGPQMANLPADTVIWDHKQSKKIVSQNAIAAGSHYVTGKDATDPRKSGGGNSNSSDTKKNNSDTKKNNKDTSKNNKKAEGVINKAGRLSLWWENMARRVDATQRKVDKTASKFEKIIQGGGKSSTRANADAIGKEYAANLNKIISLSNDQITKATQELKDLDKNKASKKQSGKKKQYNNGAENIAQISYTNKKGKSKQKFVNIGQYIKEQDGTYVVDEAKIKKNVSDPGERQAIADAADKALNDKLQKLYNAEDTLAKAQEALEKMADDTYEAFDQWDKTITQVYLLGQRLEQLAKQQSVYEAAFDTEISRLTAGFGNAFSSVERINSALAHSQDMILSQVNGQSKLIDDTFIEYESLLNLDTYYQNTVQKDPGSTKAKEDYEMMKETLTFLKSIDITDMNNFDYTKAVQQLENQNYSKNAYDKIKNGLDKIHDTQEAYYSSIEDSYKLVNDLYGLMNEYESFISEFEQNLLEGIEDQTKNEIDKLDKLNSSLSKAYKDLLDEVKKRLDERRQKEDNQKTESDISKKQQRLAMLQADTSGGHQVEIAQLQKEIAEARQNYQRSLEDQLLEKLQNQADIAEKQRERQIELLEGQIEIASQLGTNLEEVKKWLQDPDANFESIRQAYYSKHNYDTATPEEQANIKNQFEADFAKYLGYSEQIKYLKSLDDHLLEILHKADDQAGITHLLQDREQIQSKLDAARQKAEQELQTSGEVSTETQKEVDDLQQRLASVETAIQAKSNTSSNGGSNISSGSSSNTNTGINIKEPEVINTSATEAEAVRKAQEAEAARQKAAAEQKAKQDRYNNYMTWIKSQYKLTPQSMTGTPIDALISYGKFIGKGPRTVLEELVGGTGADPFTWENIMGAILNSNTVSRWNLAATYSENSSAIKALFKHLEIKTKSKKKKFWENYKKQSPKPTALAYKTGGIADYTGPAWLDGTPSKPELVLNARDTQNFLALRDVLSSALNSTNSINNSYSGDNIFEININVDKIEKDYDVDRVIEKVKKEITKGAGYRNVTQVRNFR